MNILVSKILLIITVIFCVVVDNVFAFEKCDNSTVKNGIVKITHSEKVGTGFIVAINAKEKVIYIMTVDHIFDNNDNSPKKVLFKFREDTEFTANILGRDVTSKINPDEKLALLSVRYKNNGFLKDACVFKIKNEGIGNLESRLKEAFNKREEVKAIGCLLNDKDVLACWQNIKFTEYDKYKNGNLYFKASLVHEGISGGPVFFTKNTEIIGTVTSGDRTTLVTYVSRNSRIQEYLVTLNNAGIDSAGYVLCMMGNKNYCKIKLCADVVFEHCVMEIEVSDDDKARCIKRCP